MKRTALTAIALTLAAAPFAAAETKDYAIDAFDTLHVKGAISVVYEAGAAPSVTVEQKDGDFSDIEIEMDGDILKIWRTSLEDSRGWNKRVSVNEKDGEKVVKINGKRKPTYVVRVTGTGLTEADARNSSDIDASGIDADDFEGNVSSSSDVILAGRAGNVRLNASSSGDLDARNLQALDLTIDASSSSDVYARNGGGALRIEASSSSDVEVSSEAKGAVEVDASSSADVTLTGSCAEIEIEASSSADIDASDYTCSIARVQASSGADVSAHAASELYARASSGADIDVSGAPQTLDIKDSSGGDITVG